MSVIAKHTYRSQFLKSEWWQNFRLEVLVKRKGRCYLCGKEGHDLDIHHVRYPKKWRDTTINDVVPLCRGCHEEVHEWFNNERQGWKEFRLFYVQLWFNRGVTKLQDGSFAKLSPKEAMEARGYILIPELRKKHPKKRSLTWFEEHVLGLGKKPEVPVVKYDPDIFVRYYAPESSSLTESSNDPSFPSTVVSEVEFPGQFAAVDESIPVVIARIGCLRAFARAKA